MKPLYLLLIALITSPLNLSANEQDLANKIQQYEAELFTERDKNKFPQVVTKAKELGIHKQIILEATFLFYVDTENYKGIASLSDTFKEHLNKFNLDTSKIFTTKEQWQSVIQYSLALQALQKNDHSTFKKHITEAYWLSPETASAFSHHITNHRNKKIMKQITIQQNRMLPNLLDQKSTSFKQLINNKKALILRFWSPWNQQLDTTYPIIENIAKQCKDNKITFASIITGQDKQLVTAAKESITQATTKLPSLWLMDPNKKSIAKQLRISDLPTIVIITKEGKISYHGAPNNKSLWDNLTKIEPAIQKPNIETTP